MQLTQNALFEKEPKKLGRGPPPLIRAKPEKKASPYSGDHPLHWRIGSKFTFKMKKKQGHSVYNRNKISSSSGRASFYSEEYSVTLSLWLVGFEKRKYDNKDKILDEAVL